MEEIWKDIKGYEWLYQVSDKGKIYSYPREWSWWHNWKVLSLYKSTAWYSNLSLSKNKTKIRYIVSRLVAEAFLWLNINDSNILACHKSEKLIDWFLNNSADNLWLWTHKSNAIDKVKKGRNFLRVREISQYSRDWHLIKIWEWASLASRELNIARWNISSCCSDIRKTAWGFKWKFN